MTRGRPLASTPGAGADDVVALRPMRMRVATIATASVAVVLALGLVIVGLFVVSHGAAAAAYHRPAPPAPTGVFRDGGVPTRDPVIEHVLADELPHLVMLSFAVTGHDLLGAAERQRRIHELRDASAFTGHGPELATAWRAMVDDLDQWMDLGAGDRGFGDASNELRARVDVVSDQLAAAGLGYYLDAEVVDDHARRRAGIFAYSIDDVVFVLAGAQRVRVLRVRRLDHLEVGPSVLGMKAEELGDPVVLLDQVDDKVATQIIPVLAGMAYTIGDDDWARTPAGRGVAAIAGDSIRRELVTALGADTDTVEHATARCRELVATSIGHHEAQHGLDQERGVPEPDALAAVISDPHGSPFAVRARFELSAYVSQIASDTWLPQLSLWNLARHGFRRGTTRTEESFVAVVVIEGLARQLHIPSLGPVVHNGAIDRDRLAALVAPIAARRTIELRSAAAALWAELFDRKLVRLVDPR